ncbi:MAG: carboxypeptidase-like regulatory domain-containing protein [Planctomycetaceae bacterium]
MIKLIGSRETVRLTDRRPWKRWHFGGLCGPFVLIGLLAAGCSGERKPPNEKPVIPVSGVVLVDGEPKAGIQIRFHAEAEDPRNATLSMAKTDEEGLFKAWTYRVDDGVPPGEYTVTFNDQSETKPHMRSGPDLFKGRYSDPKTSNFKLTVPEKGMPIDMGTIELSRSRKK